MIKLLLKKQYSVDKFENVQTIIFISVIIMFMLKKNMIILLVYLVEMVNLFAMTLFAEIDVIKPIDLTIIINLLLYLLYQFILVFLND